MSGLLIRNFSQISGLMKSHYIVLEKLDIHLKPFTATQIGAEGSQVSVRLTHCAHS